jgi:hypothetical protein
VLDDDYDLVYKLLKIFEQLGLHTSARIRLAKSLSNCVVLDPSNTYFARQTDVMTISRGRAHGGLRPNSY